MHFAKVLLLVVLFFAVLADAKKKKKSTKKPTTAQPSTGGPTSVSARGSAPAPARACALTPRSPLDNGCPHPRARHGAACRVARDAHGPAGFRVVHRRANHRGMSRAMRDFGAGKKP